MENCLLIDTLGPNVVVENKLVERTLQDNEHNAHPHLNYCRRKHVPLTKNWQVNPILKVADRQNLFTRIGLHDFSPNFLFKLVHILPLVLKE